MSSGDQAGDGGASGSSAVDPILGAAYPGKALSVDYLENPELGYYGQADGVGAVCPWIHPPTAPYCIYFGALGSRPYLIESAPACGTRQQITEFAGFGTVFGNSWHSSPNDFFWQFGLDDRYDGTKGIAPWPAVWNGVLVGFELSTQSNVGVGHFTIDWERRFWHGAPDDGSVEITFAPAELAGGKLAYPVIGRWRREYGERLGLFQGGKFYLDWDGDNAWSDADRVVTFDAPGIYPVAADFVPGGGDELALYKDGSWYIDVNGSYTWDGVDGGDAIMSYGKVDTLPVVARDGWARDCQGQVP